MKQKNNSKKAALEITGIERLDEDTVAKALKEVARIPEERWKHIMWEDNGCPRKRSKEESEIAATEAGRWARAEIDKHKNDLQQVTKIDLISAEGKTSIPFVEHLMRTLFEARTYENIEYLWSSARSFASTADAIMYRRKNISAKNLEWCGELLAKAQSLYNEHRRRGGHDNDFAPLGEDIYYAKFHVDNLVKLGEEEIGKINAKVDEDLRKYAHTVKNKELITYIEHEEFDAMVQLKNAPINHYNNVAQRFAFGAEEAIRAGSKEWAESLFKIALELYKKYTSWQRLHGITPNTSNSIPISADPEFNDLNLVHKTLKSVKVKLDSMQ